MKRKTSETPTRIYSYGCLLPIAGAELLEDQLRLANRYYNKLIEIERRRREAVDKITLSWSDDLGALDTAAQQALRLEEQYAIQKKDYGDKAPESAAMREIMRVARAELLCQAYELILSRRSEQSVSNLEALDKRVKSINEMLAVARAEVKALRAGKEKKVKSVNTKAAAARVKQLIQDQKAAKTDLQRERERLRTPALRCAQRAIGDIAGAEIRSARAACGLYSATYLKTEEAAGQAAKTSYPGLPHFQRYDGSGKIAVQLVGGISVKELFSGEDTQIRIKPVPEDTFYRRRHHRRLASRTVVKIRAGSNTDRTPKWVDLPIILHRPLPDDAVIKWAWIFRRRIGCRHEYRLQLVFESNTFRTGVQKAGRGQATIAIDLGWRKLEDGEIRVAYWLDDQGNKGQFLVPRYKPRTGDAVVFGHEKPEDLRSIRDKLLDAEKTTLRTWLAATSLPDWLKERTRYLHTWRAPGKLGALLTTWKKQRFDGDEEIVRKLEAWSKQDRHLLDWESSQRDRAQNHRREEYRLIANKIARVYSKIIIEVFDLRTFAKAKQPEDGLPSDGRRQRSNRMIASPSELRNVIRQAAVKTGAEVIEESAEYTTLTCALCGFTEKWDAAPAIIHTCGRCGEEWDQDENACRNLLGASGKAITSDGEALENGKGADPRGKLRRSEFRQETVVAE